MGMYEPTYKREKTLKKIVLAVEKMATEDPNPDTLSDEDLADRRAKIENTFRKLNEKR